MNSFMSIFIPLVLSVGITTATPIQAEASVPEIDTKTQIYESCIYYGLQYDIEPELLQAIVERESNYDVYAYNDGCIGLMQISEYWHRDRMARLGVNSLYDIDGNIHVGADILSELIATYNDIPTALMAYHGEKNFLQASEQGYVSRYALYILERAEQIKEEELTTKGEADVYIRVFMRSYISAGL